MQLYIDTTDGKYIYLALGQNGEVVAKKTCSAKHQQSEKLLKEIDRLLQKGEKTKRSLRGVVVTSGPGKFTATRIGVTTANALAYALNIPVAGVARDAYNDINEWIAVGKQMLGRKKKFRNNSTVDPVYDGEPNITLKK